MGGGEHRTTFWHPAMRAGVASISTVEKSGAEPPGIYRPTDETGRVTCWQRTPGWVSTSTGGSVCAEWNVSIFLTAAVIACFNSSLRRAPAAAISSGVTRSAVTSVLSNLALYSRRASSPRVFTLSRISLTVRVILSEAEIAGRVSSARCCSGLQLFQSIRVLKLMVFTPSQGSALSGLQNPKYQRIT